MAGHNDPKLLYTVNNIKAYHIQNGEEASLTPAGPQTLSLLMVPTSSPFADLSTATPQNEAPDEDFYLHLHLPPELDLPLPATTQIYHQPPSSYLIPRWDLGPDAGAFTRIEFPGIGHGVTQEDVDTFETILAQCTAFLERAKPPLPSRPGEKGGGSAGYNPQDYGPGGKYADEKGGEYCGGGQIVLIDEDDGSVVGELGDSALVHESAKLNPGSKDPVEVEIAPDGRRIEVRPISDDYLRMAKHPAYKGSSIVQNAATASRLIVTTSSKLGNMLTSGADNFTQKTNPVAKPLEFKESTHAHVRRINTLTQGAAGLSNRTVGQATNAVQNLAAKMSGHKKDRARKGFDEKGNPLPEDEYKPGLLNKSMIAFSTIADGVAYSGKNLLTTSGAAASTVVGHRWGEEAGSIAANLAGGVKNVGLVYIDVTGVSRRAVIKSVAKGMVGGRVRGGGEVVVGGGDGGAVPEEDKRRMEEKYGLSKEEEAGATASNTGGFTPQAGEYRPVGFGNQAPPRYEEFGTGQGSAGAAAGSSKYRDEKR
jgi:spartin